MSPKGRCATGATSAAGRAASRSDATSATGAPTSSSGSPNRPTVHTTTTDRRLWRAHYRTPAGARRNKTFARKIDAERFLATVESAKLTGTYVDPQLAKVTVGLWADRWLAGQAHLKPSTHSRYAGIIRKQIRPKWGRIRLSSVSHADVQAWVTTLSKNQSPASVAKIHRVLSLILDMAVKDGRLARNVATGVNLPRVGKHEHRYLTHDQVDDLAHACGYPVDPDKHASYDTAPTRHTASSSSSSPTPESGSARWPPCASTDSTWPGTARPSSPP
jgi:hypothetical protein